MTYAANNNNENHRNDRFVVAMLAIWLVILAIIATSLTSCTVSKHKDKSDVKADTTIKAQVSTEIKTVETVDTNVTVKGSSDSVNTSVTDLVKKGAIIEDTPEETIIVSYDSSTKKVKIKTIVKDRQETVDFNRITTTKTNAKVFVKEASNTKEKEKDKKTTFNLPTFMWIGGSIFLLLLLLVGGWRIYKMFKPKI